MIKIRCTTLHTYFQWNQTNPANFYLLVWYLLFVQQKALIPVSGQHNILLSAHTDTNRIHSTNSKP